MNCEHRCNEVGGPWIAENPACPVHGAEAVLERAIHEREKKDLTAQVQILTQCMRSITLTPCCCRERIFCPSCEANKALTLAEHAAR